jgi:hypothetical protein
MHSFWTSLYDKARDRRYGALFLSAIPAFLGLLVLGVMLERALRELDPEECFLQALPGLALLALAWVLSKFRRAQTRRRASPRHTPLSRDELRVARSKLVKGRSF